jgi:hypothetical protein
MPTTLTTPAIEQSTYVITVPFADETGASVAPNAGTLTWSLLTKDGTVVNSRSNVPITSASTVTIVLHGADLALVAGQSKTRKVTIKGLYNSTLGTGLELKDEITFSIVNLVGIV